MATAAVIPPSLKLITGALRRAEELDRDQNNEAKVVAYYCRFYCVSKGSKLCSKPPSTAESEFLASQMKVLEYMKPGLDINQEKGSKICRSYALSVFEKADNEDRAGMADKATAKLFYAAGTFFDILEQFGPVDNELVEKKKYAKWKATEIANAIKTGQKPTPGAYGEGVADMFLGEDEDAAAPSLPPSSSSSSSSAYDIPSARVVSSSQQHTMNIPPVQNNLMYGGEFINSSSSQYQNTPTFTKAPLNNLDPRVKDSMELCSFAIAAMKKNELEVAKERLREALERLEFLGGSNPMRR